MLAINSYDNVIHVHVGEGTRLGGAQSPKRFGCYVPNDAPCISSWPTA